MIRVKIDSGKRTPMMEDVGRILEGTLHMLQLYTDILNVVCPKTMVVDGKLIPKFWNDKTNIGSCLNRESEG